MNELDEVCPAIEAFCEANDLDVGETEFVLDFNAGASSLEATADALLLAIEEGLDEWWMFEIWDRDSRYVIATIELNHSGLHDVTYAYGGQQ